MGITLLFYHASIIVGIGNMATAELHLPNHLTLKFLFKNWLIIPPACKISEEKTFIVA